MSDNQTHTFTLKNDISLNGYMFVCIVERESCPRFDDWCLVIIHSSVLCCWGKARGLMPILSDNRRGQCKPLYHRATLLKPRFDDTWPLPWQKCHRNLSGNLFFITVVYSYASISNTRKQNAVDSIMFWFIDKRNDEVFIQSRNKWWCITTTTWQRLQVTLHSNWVEEHGSLQKTQTVDLHLNIKYYLKSTLMLYIKAEVEQTDPRTDQVDIQVTFMKVNSSLPQQQIYTQAFWIKG